MSHMSCQVIVLQTGFLAVAVFVDSALFPHHWMPHLIPSGLKVSKSEIDTFVAVFERFFNFIIVVFHILNFSSSVVVRIFVVSRWRQLLPVGG